MGLTGGGDLMDLKPLDHEGNVNAGELGTHRSNHVTLNVSNPQPGFHYFWCRHPSSERHKGAMLKRMLPQGWEVVPPDAPEHKGRHTPSYHYPELGLDSYQAHGDLLLLRIPLEKYRTNVCEPRAAAARAAVSGPTDDFMSRGEPLQQRFGAGADGPIYFRVGGHGVTHNEG